MHVLIRLLSHTHMSVGAAVPTVSLEIVKVCHLDIFSPPRPDHVQLTTCLLSIYALVTSVSIFCLFVLIQSCLTIFLLLVVVTLMTQKLSDDKNLSVCTCVPLWRTDEFRLQLGTSHL